MLNAPSSQEHLAFFTRRRLEGVRYSCALESAPGLMSMGNHRYSISVLSLRKGVLCLLKK